MFCTNCGSEIKDDLKFCPECGAEIGASKSTQNNKTKIIVAVSTVVIICLIAIISYFAVNNKKDNQVANKQETSTQVEEVKEEKQEQNSASSVLNEINRYQAKYFEIIKRHDALLQVMSDYEADRDLDELDNLFAEVKGKITNNDYLNKYNYIDNYFESNAGETTLEINEYAQKNYEAVDKLLNDVYKEVKTKLSEEDFEQLKLSQRKWLKEVDAYETVFEQQGLGSIGNQFYLSYLMNMTNFRTLLLMLYL